MRGAGRPPSPPLSQGHSGSSESSPTFSAAGLTPPESPPSTVTPPPPPPRSLSLSSPLPPLPIELFRLSLAFLAPSAGELGRLLLVSRAWHAFVASEAELWTSLAYRLDRADDLARAQTSAARASVNGRGRNARRAGIRSLRLGLGARREDAIDPAMAVDRLVQLIDMLQYACVPAPECDAFGRPRAYSSTLSSLVLSLEPPTQTTVDILRGLADAVTDPLFSHLQSLDLRAAVHDFLVTRNFLSVLPHLAVLKVVCINEPNLATRPSAFGWAGDKLPRVGVSNLRQLSLHGTTVRELALPLLPHLSHITLSNVSWEGRSFFLLLRLCRSSLVSLECIDLEMIEIEGSEEEDWQMHVDIRDPDLVDAHFYNEADSLEDEVMPIVFPALQYLHLSHEVTPPFFASLEYADCAIDGEAAYATPTFVMPALLRAVMDDISVETDADDGDGPLTVFGRNSPSLLTFELTSSLANDQSVFACLAGMQGRLRNLVLTDTNVTDRLLVHLPNLTPRLQSLDVRRCDVTIQGVARLIEVSRECAGRPDQLGLGRLTQVRVDPPRWSDAEYIAYRWLAYVGFLVRDEWDFESDGPPRAEDRRQWIRAGKLDYEKEEQKRRNAERRREEERKQQAALAALRPTPHAVSAFSAPPPRHRS